MSDIFCQICRHPAPGHEPDCPVLTGEPQPGLSETIIKISREVNDPICPRVSMGGWLDKGLYCVYRLGPDGGSRNEIIAIVTLVLEALKNTPPIT